MVAIPKYPISQIYPDDDSYSAIDPDTKRLVLEYLADESFHTICSTGVLALDRYSGETLPWYSDTMVDEDGFYWLITLPYFVQKYDWSLPDEFIGHVLKKRSTGWRPTELINDFVLI